MSDIEGQVKNEQLDAEHEARRRLALAQIRQYPDAALKMQARPVERFDDEGCLSIQGILVPVERAVTVTLVGRDEQGEDVRYELEDVYARAAQHESDHLDGVLMIDRTTPEARREALGALRPRIVLS